MLAFLVRKVILFTSHSLSPSRRKSQFGASVAFPIQQALIRAV